MTRNNDHQRRSTEKCVCHDTGVITAMRQSTNSVNSSLTIRFASKQAEGPLFGFHVTAQQPIVPSVTNQQFLLVLFVHHAARVS